MKKIFLLTMLIFSINIYAKVLQVSAGNFHVCALDDNGVQCWGYNNYGETDVPILKNPQMVSAGHFYTCAVDDNGVQCWGYNNYGQTYVPILKNPKMVSMGAFHTCALDDNGVRCWGESSKGQTNVPKLKNPRMVSAGDFHTCALDDKGVQCWGKNVEGQTMVPPLKNPQMVSAGQFHTCAVDDNGVQCWGRKRQTIVPPLNNPKMVSVGNFHTCALDDKGVQCWGGNEYGQTDVPILKNPQMVSVRGDHTCALDVEGVKCWGSDKVGQNDVPDRFRYPINLGNLHEYLYKDSAEFFQNVNEYLLPVEKDISDKLLLFSLLEIVIDEITIPSVGMSYFKNSFKDEVNELKNKVGVGSFAEINLDNRKIVLMLKLSKDALSSCHGHLIGENQRSLESAVTLLSKTIATSSALDIKLLNNSLKQYEPLFEKLAVAQRTRGRGLMIQTIVERLKN
ncbi:MAG: hypothetical protein A2381_19255 [Bdellovibrionales bacterium RIFOXYB1_FULL_37_110]|nr:MAG: hypothetical protein A2181_00170 [Bdellovibrionales bacterium RIFOXYA1_FULL_38_20]OFZ49516.1 MAG: hypothetical protein A2417_04405 [Bdellovibrionales bacterium RIFOXYC1_FULL_37_79]OFZ58670.1 MAG: hypothetical protein A2381_19255 [Bdellovibrionales bacterium RIFOXYB1_FULL_37_110]OFZ63212.1 MAG: hypothetical protein A2577_16830 [Bdellovibrionales bacterium RIFOXYD1_FULL_36_51]